MNVEQEISNYSYIHVTTGTIRASMATQPSRTGNTNVQNTCNISNLDTGNASNLGTSLDTQNLNIDNNLDSLFLHNNDQPGMIFIFKKLLGSENFSS